MVTACPQPSTRQRYSDRFAHATWAALPHTAPRSSSRWAGRFQRLLGFLALGDVHDRTDGAAQSAFIAVAREDRVAPSGKPSLHAVGSDDPVLRVVESAAFGIERSADIGCHAQAILLVNEGEELLDVHRAPVAHAEHLAAALVEFHEASVRSVLPDAQRCDLQRGHQPVLALAQRFLSPLALGDVSHHGDRPDHLAPEANGGDFVPAVSHLAGRHISDQLLALDSFALQRGHERRLAGQTLAPVGCEDLEPGLRLAQPPVDVRVVRQAEARTDGIVDEDYLAVGINEEDVLRQAVDENEERLMLYDEALLLFGCEQGRTRPGRGDRRCAGYTTPWSTIAFATLRNPAMLAPFT